MKYGPGLVTAIDLNGRTASKSCVWPTDKCKAKITFPAFVKTPS